MAATWVGHNDGTDLWSKVGQLLGDTL